MMCAVFVVSVVCGVCSGVCSLFGNGMHGTVFVWCLAMCRGCLALFSM